MKHFKNKKGITLILLALFLVLLLVFASLAIDIAYMYLAKNELQVAADAAALAGAGAGLSGTDNSPAALVQETARQAAWRFACRNRAAGSNVYLVTNTPADCNTPPTGASLNGSNNAVGDIIVGHWSSTNTGACATTWEVAGGGYFCRANGNTGLSVNAIKARPGRTGADPVPGVSIGGNPVSLFLGNILGLIPGAQAWPLMSVRAEAIAVRGGLTAPGLSICTNTCDNLSPSPSPANPIVLVLAPTSEEGTDVGIAWTAFDDKQAPDLGPNGDVADYIWGRKKLTNPCGICITTNNGLGATFTQELPDAFESTTYDTANKTITGGTVVNWTVMVPVVTQQSPCTGTSVSCPPGSQGNKAETYFIIRVAKMRIIGVGQFEIEVIDKGKPKKKNVKGVKIDELQCDVCPDITFSAGGVRLVK